MHNKITLAKDRAKIFLLNGSKCSYLTERLGGNKRGFFDGISDAKIGDRVFFSQVSVAIDENYPREYTNGVDYVIEGN